MDNEMKLIFEKGREGRRCTVMPRSEVPPARDLPPKSDLPALPELSEIELVRHYMALSRRSYGVDNGFYPLGSCTMKYNPKLNETVAALEGFCNSHPLAPQEAVQGSLEALYLTERLLCEITGMDAVTFQPAAGAHGEYTGLMLIRAYHQSRGDKKRVKVLVPDAAHGTNPASAAMAGFSVVCIPSAPDGGVDMAALQAAAGDDTAALMLTNPSTLGLFEKNIEEIAKIVHDAGGLLYYDGANLNAVMGLTRPGDMGFDVMHLNLHKTFSTPHGGGGPGSGAVACKDILSPFLPVPTVEKEGTQYRLNFDRPQSIGKVKSFYGNFLVVIKALSYMLTLGSDGIADAAKNAVLNANYLMNRLAARYDVPYPGPCMHEFVLSLEGLREKTGVSALDIAKGLIDYGIHPPTMYFPMIVHEALMLEPTETETKETLDRAADALLELYDRAAMEPEALKTAPNSTYISRPDEVTAARSPVLRYKKEG